jgi:iron complex outermembrane receptor protein
MIEKQFKYLFFTTIALSQLINPSGAFAADNADENNSLGLEEVIVTAQRKEETLQDAAIPISVATSDELSRAGVDTSAALNNVAPSLFVVRGSGANSSYFIRGVGNFTNNGYSDPAIAFNVDGVYVGRPTSTTGAFLDLERVEVLKGPQGTLYGRNATAGAINLLPAKPTLGERDGYFNVGAGNFGKLESTGAFNFDLGESTAARIAATTITDDGFNDDDTSEKDEWATRAQIYHEFNSNLDLRLSVDYAESAGTGPGIVTEGNYTFNPGAGSGELDLPGTYAFNVAPGAASDPFGGIHTQASQDYVRTLVTTPAFTTVSGNTYPSLDNTYLGVTSELNAALGDVSLVVISAYREGNLDTIFNGPGFRAALVDEESEQVSLEARISGEAGIVDWIVGAYYFDERVDGNSTFAQFSINSIQDYVTDSESFAGFVRATVNISESLRLVGGLRYTKDDKTIDAATVNLIELCSTPPPLGAGCFGGPTLPAELTLEQNLAAIPASLLPAGLPSIPGPPVPFGSSGNLLLATPIPNNQSLSESNTSFRIAMEYDLTPENLIYVSFEDGYRSGGFSQSLGRESFEPEFIEAYTLGSKNRFMSDRLQLNAELFYWEYSDQQVSHFGFDVNGNNSFFTENIGESTIKGLDVELLYQASESVLLKSNIQYLDSELDTFEYDVPALSPLPPVTGCNYSPGVDSQARNIWNIDCSGQPGFNSPEWTVNAGIQHEWLLNDFSIITNLDVRYRDERVIGFEYTPHQVEDSVVTSDLNVRFGPNDNVWYVSAYVNNVTDKEVRTLAEVFANASYLSTSRYSPPRTYGIRFGMEF